MENAKNIKKSRGYFSPIAAVFLLLVAFILFSPTNTYAQEGTSGQKKVKVRSSVDRKRRGDRAVKPDRFQRKRQTRVTQSRPTPSRRAQPNPYAGKKRKTEASVAKQAAKRDVRQPYTASKSGERAHKGSISGGKIRTKNASSARTITPKRIQSPYKYKERRTEQDVAKSAAKRKVTRPASASPKGERAGSWASGGGRVSGLAGKSKTGRPSYQKNPYSGRSARASSGARVGPGGKKAPMSISQSGESKAVNRKNPYRFRKIHGWEKGHKGDISGRKLRANYTPGKPPASKPSFNPYFGRKKAGEKGYSGNVKPGVQSRTKSSESKPGARASVAGRSISGQKKGTGQGTAGARSISGQGRGSGKPSFNPYFGRKKTGEKGYSGNVKPGVQSVTRAAESKPGARASVAGRSISGRKKTPTKSAAAGRSISGQLNAPGTQRYNSMSGKRRRGDVGYSGNVKPNGRSASRSSESKPGSRANVASGRTVTGLSFSGKPKYGPYHGRKRRGDVAYSGNIRPGVRSITRSSESHPSSTKNVATGRTITGQTVTGRPKYGPYHGRKKRGDVAYSGNIKAGVRTATRSAEKHPSSTKNIATGRTITGQTVMVRPQYGPYYGRKKRGDVAYSGSIKPGVRSVTRSAEDGKTQRPPYLGGKYNSITGKSKGKNEKLPQQELSGSGKKSGSFQGNMKAQKPLEGGGSVARNGWNNDGKSTNVKSRSRVAEKSSAFSGYMKAKKPVVGGGSVGRNNWNNDGKPLNLNEQENKQDDFMNYSGSIKVVKRKGPGYHPSFYYHRENESSLNEKDKKVSIKLLIGRFFRSNQPSNLRKKNEKLEFDKKEQGLWYE